MNTKLPTNRQKQIYNLHAERMRFSFKNATASRTVDILSSWQAASHLYGKTVFSWIKSSDSVLRRQRAASRDTCLRFSEYLRFIPLQTKNHTSYDLLLITLNIKKFFYL